jgi:DNA-binding transcriptional LysR family regulator
MRRSPAPRLAAIDLNLLVALDALLHEDSVTAAGRSIGLSQPATSHALSRLRELVGDELLVREGRALRKTALAQQLAPTIRRLVAEIESTLLGRRGFDPKTSSRRFRLAANDYCGAVLLPGLLAKVRQGAPNVVLDVLPQQGALPVGELERGELDMVLCTYERIEAPLVGRVLYREDFMCALRKDHPRARSLSLRRYLELDHLLVANPGYGPGVVDCVLGERGLRRSVAMRVPHFLVAPTVVARTDLVLTLPRRLLAMMARSSGLRVIKPPLEIPNFAVQLAWHQRANDDPGSLWLRERVTACAAEL